MHLMRRTARDATKALRLRELRRERQAQARPEVALDVLPDRADQTVDVALADRVVRQLADQEHGVLDADREREAVERPVPAQQPLVDELDVLLRRGQEVRLDVQRPLPEA